MNFNSNTFLTTLQNYPNQNNPDYPIGIVNGWQPWTGFTGGNNMVLEYIYQNQRFRTWNLETSKPNVMQTSTDLGLMVSCKIDYERSNHQQDDHIIILTGFMLDNNAPKLCFAQAMVQFTANESYNINTGPITSGDISQSIYDFINTHMNGVPNTDSTTAGRPLIPYITKANIDSIVKSVS